MVRLDSVLLNGLRIRNAYLFRLPISKGIGIYLGIGVHGWIGRLHFFYPWGEAML